MSNHIRLTIISLVGAVGGFSLQGCFAPQPTPECSVLITSAALGLNPYYAKLKKVDGTGSCGDLTHMQVGMQRFRTQPSGGAFKLAVKTSPVTDPFLGKTFSADFDPTNNCVNEDDCQGETKRTASCVVPLDDGGVEVFDGTPVTVNEDGDEGIAAPIDGGATFKVDPANECVPVDDGIERRDPTDPDGKKLVATGDMPQFPNAAGVCAISNIEGGVQNFSGEVIDLVVGTQLTLDPITYETEFTNFNVVNSAKVPGTAFTADIKYTEGACVANYKALGFWPEIHCSDVPDGGGIDDDSVPAHKLVVSAECDPVADVDAGRFLGSGISPDFKPLCDTTLKVCVPSVDVTAIK